MLFWYQLKKMAPIYPKTDDLWRSENWPKLVSSLVSLLCLSCCYWGPLSLPSAVLRSMLVSKVV